MRSNSLVKNAGSSHAELVRAMRKLTDLLGPRLRKDKISLFILAKDEYIDVYAVWLEGGRWLGAVRVNVNGEIDTSFSYSSDDFIQCTNYKHPDQYMLIKEEKVEEWCRHYALWAIRSISSVYPLSSVFYDLEHGTLRVVEEGSNKAISKSIVILDKTSPIIFAKELRKLNVAFHTKNYRYSGRCWSDFSDYPVNLMGLRLNLSRNMGSWGIVVHKSNNRLLYLSGSFMPSGSVYLYYEWDDFEVPGTEYYVKCSSDLSKEAAINRVHIKNNGSMDEDEILLRFTDAFLISMVEFAWSLVQSLTPAGERPFYFCWNGAYDFMRISAWNEGLDKMESQNYFFSSHKFMHENLSDKQIKSLLVPRYVNSARNNYLRLFNETCKVFDGFKIRVVGWMGSSCDDELEKAESLELIYNTFLFYYHESGVFSCALLSTDSDEYATCTDLIDSDGSTVRINKHFFEPLNDYAKYHLLGYGLEPFNRVCFQSFVWGEEGVALYDMKDETNLREDCDEWERTQYDFHECSRPMYKVLLYLINGGWLANQDIRYATLVGLGDRGICLILCYDTFGFEVYNYYKGYWLKIFKNIRDSLRVNSLVDNLPDLSEFNSDVYGSLGEKMTLVGSSTYYIFNNRVTRDSEGTLRWRKNCYIVPIDRDEYEKNKNMNLNKFMSFLKDCDCKERI